MLAGNGARREARQGRNGHESPPAGAAQEARQGRGAGKHQQGQAQGLQAGFDFSTSEPIPGSALRDALEAIEPDALSPREALDHLYQLKKLLDE